MCRVSFHFFYWACGCLQTLNDTTCITQCTKPRYESRFMRGHCHSCAYHIDPGINRRYLNYTVLLCNQTGMSKTPTVEWNHHTLNQEAKKKDFFSSIASDDKRSEGQDDQTELSLEKKRKYWFEGHKKWQEIVWGNLRRKYGGDESLERLGYPKTLDWEEFKRDVEENDAKEVVKWDYQMAEGTF